MTAIVSSIVAMLTAFLPMISQASQVAKIIEVLVSILPTVVQLASDLAAPIKNIIAALQNSGAATSDQIAQLQELDAKYDQAFEAAATAAQAEDAAAANQQGQ